MYSTGKWSAYVGAVGLLFIGSSIHLNGTKFSPEVQERWATIRVKLEALIAAMKDNDEFIDDMLQNLRFGSEPACFASVRPQQDLYDYFDNHESFLSYKAQFQSQYFECFINKTNTFLIPWITTERLQAILSN
jgi:hypothetical protein